MNSPDDPPPSPARARLDALLLEFSRAIGADGITLWKGVGKELVAVANPLEPAMIGQRQPADRGLISMVYLTGQPILERQLKNHPRHDSSIDQRLGTRCVAMMAAPVESADAGGVISTVILEGNTSESDFSLASLGRLAALANELAAGWADL